MFERWHFGWLLAARDKSGGRSAKQQMIDPLVPEAEAAEADAVLEQELVFAGAEASVAAAAVATLRSNARTEAAAVAAMVTSPIKAARQSKAAPGAKEVAGRKKAMDVEEVQEVQEEEVQLCVAPNGSIFGGGDDELWHVKWAGSKDPPLKISAVHLTKLRQMHARVVRCSNGEQKGEDEDEDEKQQQEEDDDTGAKGSGDQPDFTDDSEFRLALGRVLLRYKAIGGSGFQAALGGGTFAVLRRYFGCHSECFASPLNARSFPFCSAFADVDTAFGSVGSFLDFSPKDGSFEANPPFVPYLIDAMARHMEQLLRIAEDSEGGSRPLLFAVIVGASAALRRDAAWESLQRVARGQFGRAQWLVPLQDHGYTEGHAHIMRGGASATSRMSSCETAVFIWGSSAAARRWPVTAAAEAELRASMKATVPRQLKRASKANKQAHARKAAGKRRR
jgi:hypothetical protein